VLKVDLPPMSSYGAHIRAGELVLPSALMPPGGDERFDGLAHPAHVQALTALEWAERIAKAAGTTGANIVRAQWFMADARQFAGVQLAWASRFGRAPHPFVCVQPPGRLAAPGAALNADFWIYAP